MTNKGEVVCDIYYKEWEKERWIMEWIIYAQDDVKQADTASSMQVLRKHLYTLKFLC